MTENAKKPFQSLSKLQVHLHLENDSFLIFEEKI